LITSLFQYFLLTSSYTSVLTIYAVGHIQLSVLPSYVYQFCNIHDVSWGTKGDNKAPTDLGVAIIGRNNEVEVVVPTQQKDINAAYQDALQVLAQKPPMSMQKPDKITMQEDNRLAFRTTVLTVWTMTNGLLAAIIV
jgi:chitin synthase